MELKEDDIIENFVLIKRKSKFNKKQKWTSCIKDTNIIFDLTICEKEIIEISPILNQIITFGDDKFVINLTFSCSFFVRVSSSEKVYLCYFSYVLFI